MRFWRNRRTSILVDTEHDRTVRLYPGDTVTFNITSKASSDRWDASFTRRMTFKWDGRRLTLA